MPTPPGDMPLQSHLNEFRSRMIRALAAILIGTIFAACFGIQSFEFNGYTIYYPFPDPLNNISIQLTYYMRDTLLPENVQLIQTGKRKGCHSYTSHKAVSRLAMIYSCNCLSMPCNPFYAKNCASSRSRQDFWKMARNAYSYKNGTLPWLK